MSFKLKAWWWGLLLLALVSRLYGLGDRVMSHDESIHVLTAWNTLTQGPYIHDPVYHGPLLYFLNRTVFWFLGASDFTGRLAPALAGVLLVMGPFLFRRELGERGALIASWAILLSPTMTFYSRYNRHDVLAAVFGLLLFRLLWTLQQRRRFQLVAIAGVFAGLFLTKEVSYIYGAIFGAGLGCLGVLQWKWGSAASLFQAWRGPLVLSLLIAGLLTPAAVQAFGADPLDYSRSGLLYIMPLFITIAIIAGGVGILMFGRSWPVAYLAFYAVLLAGFTWMGANRAGIFTGLFGSLGYWLSQHEVARGGQPWYFYFMLALLYEGPLILLAFVGFPAWLKRIRRPFPAMLMFWLLGSVVIYSWAGEKMPWLLMHLLLPAILFIGWSLQRLPLHWVVVPLVLAGLGLSTLSWRVNGLQANQPNELMQYAAGHEQVRTFMQWLDAHEQHRETPLRVLCSTELGWPFNWYFRDRKNFDWAFPDFQGAPSLAQYDVIMVGLAHWPEVEARVFEAFGGPINVREVPLGMTHWPDQAYRKPLREHLEDFQQGRTTLRDGWNLLLKGQPFDPETAWGTQTTYALMVRKKLEEHPEVEWPF